MVKKNKKNNKKNIKEHREENEDMKQQTKGRNIKEDTNKQTQAGLSKGTKKEIVPPKGCNVCQIKQKKGVTHVLQNHQNKNKRGPKSQFWSEFSPNTVIDLINLTISDGRYTTNRDRDMVFIHKFPFTVGECFIQRNKHRAVATKKMLVALRHNGQLKSAYPILRQ